MEKENLTKLSEAYSLKNLNEITARIIKLYKQKNLPELKNYAEAAGIVHENLSLLKIFNTLVRTFHPDRHLYYQNEIKLLAETENEYSLEQLSLIFNVLGLLHQGPKPVEVSLTEAYRNFTWTYGKEDFDDYGRTINDEEDEYSFTENRGVYDILTAVKEKEYGNLDVDYTLDTLEQIEGELDLAGTGVNDLSGIERCINIRILDLSNNEIDEVESLAVLTGLKELYLSDNSIEDISSLVNLSGLEVLDISQNNINDISVLKKLKRLHYVNIMGTKVPAGQVNDLKKQGITVID